MKSGPPSPPSQKTSVRRFAPAGLLAILALVALSVAVLYGMSGLPGKEASAGSCPLAPGKLAQVAGASRGDVAAFNAIRRPAPLVDLSFQGPDGRPRKLSDFRGKAVLLNLWATWCVPCREEMPSLDRLQAAAGGPKFEVVAVNIDTARLEKRQQFLTDVGVKSLSFYADPTADVFQTLKRAGKVVGLPTSILVDENGCELGALAGAAAWDSPDAQQLINAALQSKP